ncbi:hypothetical protein ACIA48_14590 [Mycobacterium sp. NPDC051804]|uniref:hypothetical protein n=1 Tax=Mycobacterium sp. NPDC051804 TaxID=3364295 RepID=UPI00378AC1E1
MAGSDADRFQIVDLLDALVRKSLIVTEQATGKTRFSMLETIREFADEQLTQHGVADEARRAHARYFAGREADVLGVWDSSRQRDAYTWFLAELANLRAAFRWAADRGELDLAATITTFVGVVGGMALESQEPPAWAEELIESARVAEHPRLGWLYIVASLCWMTGRIDDALSYTVHAQEIVRAGHEHIPFGLVGMTGGIYVLSGQVEKAVEWENAYLDPYFDPITLCRSNRVLQLVMAGRSDEAMAAASGVLDAAELTGNPYALCSALLAYGFAFRDVDPVKALDAMLRGLAIAHDSGNRGEEAYLAVNIGYIEARRGNGSVALDHLTLAIRINRDSGSAMAIRSPLAALAEVLTGLRCHAQAATIAGYAISPMTLAAYPEMNTIIEQLRRVLGDETYETLARQGETMTSAGIATYAFDQIELARTKLAQVR